jgi:hypothetical protein
MIVKQANLKSYKLQPSVSQTGELVLKTPPLDLIKSAYKHAKNDLQLARKSILLKDHRIFNKLSEELDTTFELIAN